MIPPLNQYGILPSGTHECTLVEIEERFSINKCRQKLWAGFQEYLALVRQVRFFAEILVGGSYVTDKENPSDIDIVLRWDTKPDPSADRRALAELMRPQLMKPRYGVQPWPGLGLDFSLVFRRLTSEEAILRGTPEFFQKGVLRVVL
jgi:predicted nucleotidyltransferase